VFQDGGERDEVGNDKNLIGNDGKLKQRRGKRECRETGEDGRRLMMVVES
jgi:hypothetical protein